MNYINSPAYAADGANTRNYYSAAHRTDYLAYAKYEWQVDDHVRLTVQPYFHHNDGGGHRRGTDHRRRAAAPVLLLLSRDHDRNCGTDARPA